MTLPCERYRALEYTEQFLKDLMDPKKTPRVPKQIRQQAYYCLRHYPGGYHLDLLATKCPDVLATMNPIDELSQLVNSYEEKKNGQKN